MMFKFSNDGNKSLLKLCLRKTLMNLYKKQEKASKKQSWKHLGGNTHTHNLCFSLSLFHTHKHTHTHTHTNSLAAQRPRLAFLVFMSSKKFPYWLKRASFARTMTSIEIIFAGHRVFSSLLCLVAAKARASE